MKEEDFVQVTDFLDRGINLTVKLQQAAPGTKLSDFKASVKADHPELVKLRSEVEDFAKQFPIPGFEAAKLKYQS